MRKYVLPVLTLLLTFSSCEKGVTDPANNESCKVSEVRKSFGTSSFLSTTFFSFDINNRVTQIDSLKAGAGDLFGLAYDTQKIQVKGMGPWIGYNPTYTLTNNLVSKYTAGNFTRDFTYDGEGYLVKTVVALGSYLETISLIYTDGNLTKIEVKVNSNPLRVYTMIYGSDTYKNVLGYDNALLLSEVLFGEPADNVLISGGHFGKASKNLVAGVVLQNSPGATQFSYEKDSKGKLTSIKKTRPDGTTEKMMLIYSCK